MENEAKSKIKMQGKGKGSGKGKGKGKGKGRKLVTFLKGPKTEPLPLLDLEEGETLKRAFRDLLDQNPLLKFPDSRGGRNRGKRKDGEEEEKEQKEEVDVKREPSQLKEELIFGMNSILKSLEKDEVTCVGVIVTDPLSTHLQLAVHDLCLQKKVPCLCVQGFQDLKTALNISSMIAIGFRSKVISETSFCCQFYRLFTEIIKRKDVTLGFKRDLPEPHQHESSQVPQNSDASNSRIMSEKDELQFSANSFKFIIPPLEELYIRRVKSNPLDATFSKSEPLGDNGVEEGADKDSFWAFSITEDDYFPRRNYPQSSLLGLKVTDENETKGEDSSFINSLILADEGRKPRTPTSFKRKLNSDESNSSQWKGHSKGPVVLRLEPSGKNADKDRKKQNIKKRKQAVKK